VVKIEIEFGKFEENSASCLLFPEKYDVFVVPHKKVYIRREK
jgi:hypothetical protein